MNHEITIRRYTSADEGALFSLMEREGDEWAECWQGANRGKYRKALTSSITYLLFQGDVLCGFARCREDDGYGLYVYDLLVDKGHRGNGYGRMLMEAACGDFPDAPTYVMSGVNPYYEKLGYEIEGTIFIVKPKEKTL